MPLDYQNPKFLEVRKTLSVFGMISFAALLFSAPCAIGCFFSAWAYQGAIDALGQPWSTIVVWGPAIILVLIAFGFGLWSIRFDGIRLKNILGVIGFFSSAAILVTGGLAICFILR